MTSLPKPLQLVVEQLSALPGVGPKSALRMAMTILAWPKDKAQNLGQSIYNLRDALCICSKCASLSDSDPCKICADPLREDERLCLVAEWDSVLVLEEAGFFKGKYLVLGGLLSPLDGVDAHNLELEKLRARLAEGVVEEVILALGTTMEAEATASYVKNMVQKEFPKVEVTRLAQGIPLGAELKYIDKETLRQSLHWRQSF
ncbi:recombination mediator RecR [Desulfohalobiaceae bacterium Ax17]|uniref:recombination mediator RecR n=1 Tax=Desulfovulcanus ferrireducens TaxID=2831190 RepID=UPI00207B9C5F|nr:recombination mediator RecR [Desulfovulcanus ferrireducens]